MKYLDVSVACRSRTHMLKTEEEVKPQLSHLSSRLETQDIGEQRRPRQKGGNAKMRAEVSETETGRQ